MEDILEISGVRELSDAELGLVSGGNPAAIQVFNNLALTAMRSPGFSPAMAFMSLAGSYAESAFNSAVAGGRAQFDSFMKGAQNFADRYSGF